jgi:plastocyanin
MADRPSNSDTGDDTDTRSTEDPPSGLPQWVKVSAIIGIIVVMVVVIVTFVGGVEHGPGMHGPVGDNEDDDTTFADAPAVAITTDEFAFEPDRVELAVGEEINVELTSIDMLHDLTVDEIDFQLVANRGETATGGLVFQEPGTYIGYCSVPGHRDAGMELEIVVTPPDGASDHIPPFDHD